MTRRTPWCCVKTSLRDGTPLNIRGTVVRVEGRGPGNIGWFDSMVSAGHSVGTRYNALQPSGQPSAELASRRVQQALSEK